ncbi:MAG: VWA domain-containing protein [Gammaproteobacteria bacterium]|nr:VWA domain-containing protein [Gammaproteobacteria bacterium]
MTLHRLSAPEIAEQLDLCFEVEFTFIDNTLIAQRIAQLEPEVQQQLLHTARRVAASHIQVAAQLCTNAITTIFAVSGGDHTAQQAQLLDSWADQVMDLYDRFGLAKSMQMVNDFDHFQRYQRQETVGVSLKEVEVRLLHFLNGLSGRKMKLAPAEGEHWSDSETIYLPSASLLLPQRELNRWLYSAIVVYHWAEARFSTFQPPLFARMMDASDHLLHLFESVNGLRLERLIQRYLPGQWRRMEQLRQAEGGGELSSDWTQVVRLLEEGDLSLQTALKVTEAWSRQLQPLPRPCYQGRLALSRVAATREKRIGEERAQFRVSFMDYRRQQSPPPAMAPERETGDEEEESDLQWSSEQAIATLPLQLRPTAESIIQDFGEIPPEYLTAAGPADYLLLQQKAREEDPGEVWGGTYHEEGAFLYDEWDHRRESYRKGWCAVRELEVEGVEDPFVEEALQRYQLEIRHLRKTFETFRNENRILKRQSSGDDLDLEALVEAQVDLRQGRELSDQLFIRTSRYERNIAVAFVVDMSGSTRGWINDAEREALLLMCEALQTLGDRYAIYGFSGVSRKRCDIYVIKRFEEGYGEAIRQRISGIRPQDYTRMGFAIRHINQILNQTGAKSRLMITLTDGKPDDYSDYHGEYGIEDTRKALLEARHLGIHAYCITIDEEAKSYLPRLYGPAAFTQIDDPRQLPYKITDIYRRLTSR